METAQHELENNRCVVGRFSMAGRKALVTGGSVSIGREIALAFAEAGADVAIQYARQADIGFGRGDAAEEMVAAIAGRGRAGIAIDADFARPGEPTRCVEEARHKLGDIDVLVVCASIQYRTPFEEVTADQLERQLQVNFKATIELLQAVLPQMRRNRFGRILTIGSVNQIAPGVRALGLCGTQERATQSVVQPGARICPLRYHHQQPVSGPHRHRAQQVAPRGRSRLESDRSGLQPDAARGHARRKCPAPRFCSVRTPAATLPAPTCRRPAAATSPGALLVRAGDRNMGKDMRKRRGTV